MAETFCLCNLKVQIFFIKTMIVIIIILFILFTYLDENSSIIFGIRLSPFANNVSTGLRRPCTDLVSFFLHSSTHVFPTSVMNNYKLWVYEDGHTTLRLQCFQHLSVLGYWFTVTVIFKPCTESFMN